MPRANIALLTIGLKEPTFFNTVRIHFSCSQHLIVTVGKATAKTAKAAHGEALAK